MSARAVPARAAFVVKSFYDAGDSLSGSMGLAFMALSMSVVWIGALINFFVWLGSMTSCGDEDVRKFSFRALAWSVPSALLTPVNLHTLYMGGVYAYYKSKLKVVQAGLSGQVELWRAYDAAIEAEKYIYQSKDSVSEMKAASKAVEEARKALKEDKRGFFSLCMRGGTAKVVASEQQQGQRGPWAAMVAPFWPLSSTAAPK